MANRQRIKPVYFVIVCVIAIVTMFAGSIAISVAVVHAERSSAANANGDSN